MPPAIAFCSEFLNLLESHFRYSSCASTASGRIGRGKASPGRKSVPGLSLDPSSVFLAIGGRTGRRPVHVSAKRGEASPYDFAEDTHRPGREELSEATIAHSHSNSSYTYFGGKCNSNISRLTIHHSQLDISFNKIPFLWILFPIIAFLLLLRFLLPSLLHLEMGKPIFFQRGKD